MWVLSQKISQRGRDVRQEECCLIKHKHKPQHTSAHMLLTPSQIHTQNQPPHCKETSTFQSSSWGSILFITKVSPFFVAAVNIKDKKNPQCNSWWTINPNHDHHDVRRERQSSFVSKWAKGRSGTVTEPARIDYYNANKLRVGDDTVPPQPHMTFFTSPHIQTKH